MSSKEPNHKTGYHPKEDSNSKSNWEADSDDNIVNDEEDTLRCGYFLWKPEWLQGFRSPRWLLVCVCWFTFTQGNFIFLFF